MCASCRAARTLQPPSPRQRGLADARGAMAPAAGAPSTPGQQPSPRRRQAEAPRAVASSAVQGPFASRAINQLLPTGPGVLYFATAAPPSHPLSPTRCRCRLRHCRLCRRPSLMCRCCWPARRTWAPRTAPAPWSATCTVAATTASSCSTCRRRALLLRLWGVLLGGCWLQLCSCGRGRRLLHVVMHVVWHSCRQARLD